MVATCDSWAQNIFRLLTICLPSGWAGSSVWYAAEANERPLGIAAGFRVWEVAGSNPARSTISVFRQPVTFIPRMANLMKECMRESCVQMWTRNKIY